MYYCFVRSCYFDVSRMCSWFLCTYSALQKVLRNHGRRQKLYCALYTKDRLGSKHDWLVNKIRELRDKIDDFEHYFPDECNEKDFIREMKNQYKRCSEDLARVNEAMRDWRKRIDEMVAALPKKYNGILEYNWANAKVEIKEENICW